MRLSLEEHPPVVLGSLRAGHDLVGAVGPAADEDLWRVGEAAAGGIGEEEGDAVVAADVQRFLAEGQGGAQQERAVLLPPHRGRPGRWGAVAAESDELAGAVGVQDVERRGVEKGHRPCSPSSGPRITWQAAAYWRRPTAFHSSRPTSGVLPRK